MSVSEDRIIDDSALLDVFLWGTYRVGVDRLAGTLKLGPASTNTPCGKVSPSLTTAYG
jgi:hypothetical protein